MRTWCRGAATVALCVLPAGLAAAGPPPIPVSPGRESGVAWVPTACPTFSWGGVGNATAYELAIFELEGVDSTVAPGDAAPAEKPRLRATLPGGATSWTPTLDRCLTPGGSYAWLLRALEAEAAGAWSEPRLFRVAGGAPDELTAAANPTGGGAGEATLRESMESAQSAVARPPSFPASPAAGPVVAAGVTEPSFEASRADGGFLLARFANRSAAGDRTAIVDIANGNASSTTWRLAVGGTGNGFGLTDGEFYLEKAGLGVVLRTLPGTGTAIFNPNGLPAFLGEYQVISPASGCGVLCGRTGLANTNGVLGEATAANGNGVVGIAAGADGRGVFGGAMASGAAGVKGLSTHSQAAAGEFEHTTTGDVLVGKALGSNVFRVDYTGKGFFNGGTQASGADFAESMAVVGEAGDYAPGDVMVIDARDRRRLARSAAPYSTLVAGVVSTRPAMLATPHAMGALELANEIPLAITGIVPCNVSAENGPIRPGDLLVTSSTPGYAMRGSRRRRMLGAVLGKALEPLARGTGKIEVLVLSQ